MNIPYGNSGHAGVRFHETLLASPGEDRQMPWEQNAARLFEKRMLDKSDLFPCIFGVDAVRHATLRYCFVPLVNRSCVLRQSLKTFAQQCEELGSRTSLVAFFEHDPSLETTEDHQGEFWRLLAELIESDDQSWPSEIDTDTESPSWEFSCHGVPFFVVANTPSHAHRRSRYFEYFAITFQPRFVFDDLGAGTTTGSNARKIIRKRLKNYDTVPPYGGLGNFGDADNREWTQYFLNDHDDVVPRDRQCPLRGLVEKGKEMSGPTFSSVEKVDLSPRLQALLPSQGSIELQNDQAGKLFGWHKHSLDEQLLVLAGDVTLFWTDADGAYREEQCATGTLITLPAGTVHGSIAGTQGAQYVISPEGGQTAVTSFLPQDEWPYPVGVDTPAE